MANADSTPSDCAFSACAEHKAGRDCPVHGERPRGRHLHRYRMRWEGTDRDVEVVLAECVGDLEMENARLRDERSEAYEEGFNAGRAQGYQDGIKTAMDRLA